MGAPAKFLFDTDFSAPHRSRERAPTAQEIAQQIAAAEAKAYQAGFDAAQREAKVQSDRRMALAIEEISIGIKGIAARFAGVEARMETEAVDVAIAAFVRRIHGQRIRLTDRGEHPGQALGVQREVGEDVRAAPARKHGRLSEGARRHGVDRGEQPVGGGGQRRDRGGRRRNRWRENGHGHHSGASSLHCRARVASLVGTRERRWSEVA